MEIIKVCAAGGTDKKQKDNETDVRDAVQRRPNVGFVI